VSNIHDKESKQMRVLYRTLFIALFFFLCYNLDMLVDAILSRTDFFAPAEYDITLSWWERMYEAGKYFFLEKLGDIIEGLILLASKLFWPFLFAAVAIPLSLPRRLAERNKWSAFLGVLLTIVSVVLFYFIKNDLAVLWQAIKSLSFAELDTFGDLIFKIKWAVVLFAINLTVLFTFFYRLLHTLKMEQLLYFFVLTANAFYIVMLDPVPGEVDDVLGVVVTAFLSLALFFDRLMTKGAGD
jgi:hypothetical protein